MFKCGNSFFFSNGVKFRSRGGFLPPEVSDRERLARKDVREEVGVVDVSLEVEVEIAM
jgi:hypothetical protein